MVDIESLRPALRELERTAEWFFRSMSVELLDGSDPQKLTVVIQTKGRRARCMGYFLSREMSYGWRNREGEGIHAISISSEYLDREPLEIIEVVLHECVHLWCWYEGVKDTSSGGMYHNRRYKEKAEEAGLQCPEVSLPGVGYGVTSIGEALKGEIEKDLKPDLGVFGLFQQMREPRKSVSKTEAWICRCEPPVTLRIARGRDVDITCNYCGGEFELKGG